MKPTIFSNPNVTINSETPMVIIGPDGAWGSTIHYTLKEFGFSNIDGVREKDFILDKNDKVLASTVIIHAAGEVAMKEMETIFNQDGISDNRPDLFRERLFGNKVFIEICSVKSGIERLLTDMRGVGVDICSMHPMSKPDEHTRITSSMLIMPFLKESSGHQFARQITQLLGMTPNEHIPFESHDKVMQVTQARTHEAAWKWLKDAQENLGNLGLTLEQIPFPKSEQAMIAGFSRIWSGDPELSARIIGNAQQRNDEWIRAEGQKFKWLTTSLPGLAKFIRHHLQVFDKMMEVNKPSSKEAVQKNAPEKKDNQQVFVETRCWPQTDDAGIAYPYQG